MTYIITMLNMKGGVGKTTSVINIAAKMKQLGKRMLLIDLDPQANLTQGLGFDDDQEKTIYTALRGDYTLKDVIASKNGIDIVPSTIDLSVADAEFNSKISREQMLKKVIKPIQNNYDIILIDCAPNLALLTVNAIAASTHYLIPMQAEYFALRGLLKLIDAVDYIKQGTESGMELLGVFLTRFNKQKTLSRDVYDITADQVKEKLFQTNVRENIALAEAQAKGISIYDYDSEMDKKSNGADDYSNLTTELLNRL